MKKKAFYKSKTILGIAIAALPQIANALAASDVVDVAAATNPEVQAVVTIAGLLLAAYGRKKAVQPISLMPSREFPKDVD